MIRNPARTLPLPFLLALLPIGCGGGDPSPAPDRSGRAFPLPRHVLIVTVDTLRADHLGCYGYGRPTSPWLDRLAREGVLFTNASAPKGQTWPSLTSMLTGLPPLAHGVRSNHVYLARKIPTLGSAARAASFGTGAFLTNYADALVRNQEKSFDRVVRADKPRVGPQERWDARALQRTLPWLKENAQRPTLTWVHFMDPHRPYDIVEAHAELVPAGSSWLADEVPLARIREVIASGDLAIAAEAFEAFLGWDYWRQTQGGRTPTYRELAALQNDRLTFDQLLDMVTLLEIDLSPQDLAYVKGRYDTQVRGCDEKLGALLTALDELGIADETLVVFTADHGDELFDHAHYPFHSASIYEGVVRIPLVLRWPGVLEPGTRIDEVVELMDVMPTLLQVFDQPIPAGVEGQSLLPLLGAPGTYAKPYAFTENLPGIPTRELPPPPLDAIYTVRDAHWKFVFNPADVHPRSAPYNSVPGKAFRVASQELYHLVQDPGERLDLLGFDGTGGSLRSDAPAAERLAHAQRLAEAHRARERLFAALQRWFEEHQRLGDDVLAEIVPDDVARTLEAMGYVSGTPEVVQRADGETPRQVRLLEELLAVARPLGNAAPSVRAEALLLQAEALLALQRPEEARLAAQRALEAAPEAERAALLRRRAELGL